MKKKILSLMLLSFILIKAYPQNSVSTAIRSKGGISQQFTALDEKIPIAFNVAQLRTLLDLNQNSELVLQRTEQDKLGFIHYRYYQTYKSIPVENTMYIIHTKNGLLKSLGGTIVTDFDSRMDSRFQQKISNARAVAIAIQHVGAKLYAWQDAGMEQAIKERTRNSKATYLPKANLVWYSPTDDVNPRALRLCYKVDVYAKQPVSRAYYFVDAITGSVLGKKDKIHFSDATGIANTAYSGPRTIHSDLVGTTYRLRDYTKGAGIITLHGETSSYGTNYTSTSSNWTLTGRHIAALDAHYGVSETYNFYMNKFGRNSYDNAGTALVSYVNEPTYLDNAFWDGDNMVFNKRSDGEPGGVTGIDVAGHEVTHGVTQETSNLEYSREPGAINESLSDIMGKSVQFVAKPNDINWTLSNDMGNFLFRNMANPNQFDQPDTYKGTHWEFTSYDNYGVHINSGVGNFMFYLLVNGGSGTNDNGDSYSVTGIGLEKADQIIYRSNTIYLTSTSKYINWRTACLNAATDLYGTGSPQVKQVANAWYAVGVGNPHDSCEKPTGLKATYLTSTSQKLSWNAATGAKQYKLQYRLSSTTAWTTVNNILSNSYTLTSLAPGNYQYKVQTVCAGGVKSAFSTILSFSTAPTYCSTSGGTTYEYINKVVLGSIANTSGDDFGYGDYTSLSTTLVAGNSVQIKLTPGFYDIPYDEYWTVFIDYNHNGVFTDAGEKVAAKSGSAAVAKSFTVPLTALNGSTRMRVIMHYGAYRNNPCGTFTEGEAEDYTVNITGGSLTGIASLNNSKADNLNSIAVTPNPVRSSTANLVLQVNKAVPVSIRVTDLTGRTLRSETISSVIAGKNNHPLNNLNLKPGTYMIVAEQGKVIVARTQFIVEK